MKIAVIAETRRADDQRAAITPSSVKTIKSKWPSIEIYIQKSDSRIYKEYEYLEVGAGISGKIDECDILIGVKEVAENALINGKTYLIFAHVAKKQEHNLSFLKAMIMKKITLIDYEYITNADGIRLVAFGFWAGVVGAYYMLLGVQKKFSNIDLPHPSRFYDQNQLFEMVREIHFPPLRIIITGDGRVAGGAAKVLAQCGIKQVNAEQFLNSTFNEAVFCVLPFQDYVEPKKGSGKNYNDFFSNPSAFKSSFLPYARVADVYIPCHFWHPESPVFFTRSDMASKEFRIRFIADISCDIPGPIPSTIRASNHATPFYDIERATALERPAFSDSDNITVMAVDNLPTAMPRDASEYFAETLIEHVIPAFIDGDRNGVLERATILKDGNLTKNFSYLRDWVNL